MITERILDWVDKMMDKDIKRVCENCGDPAIAFRFSDENVSFCSGKCYEEWKAKEAEKDE